MNGQQEMSVEATKKAEEIYNCKSDDDRIKIYFKLFIIVLKMPFQYLQILPAQQLLAQFVLTQVIPVPMTIPAS